MQRILALDIGDKTIGVAVSDPLFLSAQGVTTIERIGVKKDCDKVIDLIRSYDAGTVVCGLPLMLNGLDSPQTEKVREFVRRLSNKLKSSGLAGVSVEFYDERFTTKIAEEVLVQAGMRRKERKKVVDRQAAVVILQSYLEANRERFSQFSASDG